MTGTQLGGRRAKVEVVGGWPVSLPTPGVRTSTLLEPPEPTSILQRWLRLLLLSLCKSQAKGLESRRRSWAGRCWGNLQR